MKISTLFLLFCFEIVASCHGTELFTGNRRFAMGEKKCNRSSGIGGQAVLEGIMMKNKEKYSVAVRKPDGKIELKIDTYKGVTGESKLAKIPFVRGVFNFVESLVLGTKTLTYSASFYEEEDGKETKTEKFFDKLFGGKAEDILMGITVAISIVIAIALFMVLPYVLSVFLNEYIRNESLIALVEGGIRILIFLLYISLISCMKDIKRVYQYHGAEHKCINCIEKGRPLTVDNVMKSSRQHKRCGTSFLFFVIFVSIILFFFIRVDQPALRLILRIVLIPVIAGISYEILRLAGKSDNIFITIISYPGMLLQKMTTKEPDREMVEVAITAVEAVFDWKEYFKETFQCDIDAQNCEE